MVSKKEISKLRWQCRRGMRELDILMERYLFEQYETASEVEQQAFRDLLDLQDPTLFAYLLGREKPIDAAQLALVELLSVYQQERKA